MILAQPLPLTEARARRLASTWVDLTLAAERAASGAPLDADSIRERVTARARVDAAIASLLAQEIPEAPLEPDQVREIYDQGQWRWAAHVQFNALPGMAASTLEAQRARAVELRDRLEQGLSWDEAVAQSDDSASVEQRGQLGLLSSGDMPPEFDRALADLAPGGLSGVVQTVLGFHIIRRPPLAEIAPAFTDAAVARLTAQQRAVWSATLAQDRALRVGPGAQRTLRRLAGDPWASGTSDTLVFFDGGGLTTTDLGTTLRILPPEAHAEMVRAAPQALVDFLQAEGGRAVLAHEATVRVVQPPDSVLEGLREQAGTVLAEAAELLGREAPDGEVTTLMEAMLARRMPWLELPTPLVESLRSAAPWSVDPATLRAAVAQAQRMLEATSLEPTPLLEPATGVGPGTPR